LRLGFDVSLYHWHDPSLVHLLVKEVLADVVIPEVALVNRVPHSWSAPWVPGSIPRRSLPVRRQVKVEAEVKVSSCEKLLDSLDILLELLRLLYGLAVCWIERNKLSSHH